MDDGIYRSIYSAPCRCDSTNVNTDSKRAFSMTPVDLSHFHWSGTSIAFHRSLLWFWLRIKPERHEETNRGPGGESYVQYLHDVEGWSVHTCIYIWILLLSSRLILVGRFISHALLWLLPPTSVANIYAYVCISLVYAQDALH